MAQENTNNTSPVEDAQLTEKPNYQRTKYSTTVHVRDRETGEMKTVEISRTVYVNTNIDPNLVVPAGTVISGYPTKEAQTNLERMQSGKPPLIEKTDENGQPIYLTDESGAYMLDENGQKIPDLEVIELHHMSSAETQGVMTEDGVMVRGYGTLAELPGESVHDKYSKVLHGQGSDSESFRKDKEIIRDENGDVIERRTIKSEKAYVFENFSGQYWKDRGNAYAREQGLPQVSTHNTRAEAKAAKEADAGEKYSISSSDKTLETSNMEAKADYGVPQSGETSSNSQDHNDYGVPTSTFDESPSDESANSSQDNDSSNDNTYDT